MKYSKYNITVDYDKNNYMILNTLSGAIVLLDKYEYDNKTFDDKDKSRLFENGILVDDSLDEKKLVDSVRYNYCDSPDTFSYVILPTTACNARCLYCYEHGFVTQTMDVATAQKVAQYIINNSLNKKTKIQFFGGEPLLCVDIIDSIIKQMSEQEVVFSTSFITNASQINDEIIAKMISEWHTTHIQITLDGIFDEYDKRKQYRDGTKFIDIIRIIGKLALNGISVNIRLNIDKDNVDNIIQLIDFLNMQNWNRNYISVFPVPLYYSGKSTQKKERCFLVSEIDEFFLPIYKKMYECGFIRSPGYFKFGLRTHFCGANIKNHIVIAPNGNLFKCQHLGSFNSSVGSIDDIDSNKCYNNKFQSNVLNEECENCVWLPSCQGGCRVNPNGESGVFMCPIIKYTTNSSIFILKQLIQGGAFYEQ